EVFVESGKDYRFVLVLRAKGKSGGLSARLSQTDPPPPGKPPPPGEQPRPQARGKAAPPGETPRAAREGHRDTRQPLRRRGQAPARRCRAREHDPPARLRSAAEAPAVSRGIRAPERRDRRLSDVPRALATGRD